MSSVVTPVGTGPFTNLDSTTLGVVTVATGDLLVLAVDCTGTDTVTSVADTGGGFWASAGVIVGPTSEVEIWYSTVSFVGSMTITITTAASGSIATWAQEFTSDVGSYWLVDQTGSASGSAPSAIFPFLNPTDPGELYVAVVDVLNWSDDAESDAIGVYTEDPKTDNSQQTVIYNASNSTDDGFVPDVEQFPAGAYAVFAVLFVAVTFASAPTLQTPFNGGYMDPASSTFTWDYNGNGGEPESGYQFRRKVGAGAYEYWDATGGSFGGSPVTNSYGGGAPGSVTIPSGEWTPGTTYDWSVASVDNVGVGPFAADQIFTSESGPTVTVTDPAGGVATVTNPTVQWSESLTAGTTVARWRVVTYSAAQYGTPGFAPFAPGPSLDDSGFMPGASDVQSYTIGTVIPDGTVCRSYVYIEQTPGGQEDSSFIPYTVTIPGPSTPSIVASLDYRPTSGLPGVKLVVTDTNTGAHVANGVVVLRVEDNVWVRGASPANPFPITPGGTVTIFDHEASVGSTYTYRAAAIYKTGSEFLASAFSGPSSAVTVAITNWWMWIPGEEDNAIQLRRSAKASSGSAPTGGDVSIAVDRDEDQGTFLPFGRQDTVVVRGDLRLDRFDLDLVFVGDGLWTAFDNMRNRQTTVVLQSDMQADPYFMALGGKRTANILRGGRTNPNTITRLLTITCSPELRPEV